MQFFTPSFTKDFMCIADKCSYSCCKNWTILFKEEHRKKFLAAGIYDIDSNSVKKSDDLYSIRLTVDGSCPYLDKKGLCGMILRTGSDDILCGTCETFPRIIQIRNNVMEYTLSNACPAVLQLLENTPCPMAFELEDVNELSNNAEEVDDSLLSCREMMIDLMQISDFPIWVRLYLLYSFASKIRINKSDINNIIKQYNSVDHLIEIYNQISTIDVNMPTKLQLLANYLSIIEIKDTMDNYEKHYIELYDYATSIPMNNIISAWAEFDNIFSQESQLFENICVNNIFKSINLSNTENFFYSTFILIEMISLIKFTMLLEWLYTNKEPIFHNKYNIITYFARKLEHGDFDSILKHIKAYEKQGWLESGYIFTMIR